MSSFSQPTFSVTLGVIGTGRARLLSQGYINCVLCRQSLSNEEIKREETLSKSPLKLLKGASQPPPSAMSPKSFEVCSLIQMPQLPLLSCQYPAAKVGEDCQILVNPEDFLYESRKTEITRRGVGGGDLIKKHSFKSVLTNLFLCVVELLSTGKMKFPELTQRWEFFVRLCQLSPWHFSLGFFLLSFFC